MRDNPPYRIMVTRTGQRPMQVDTANGRLDAASKVRAWSVRYPQARLVYALPLRQSSWLHHNPPQQLKVVVESLKEEVPWWPDMP